MTQSERISALKKDIPELKDEIISRSWSTVEGRNYVYVTQGLNVCVTDVDTHFFQQRLIHFSTGPITETMFENELQEAIRHELQFPEPSHNN